MIVVGGTYRESSLVPDFDRIAGSGLRAALVADALGADVELVTAAAASERDAVEVTVNGYGVRTDLRGRSQPVEFSYFTPVDTPVIVGRDAELIPGEDVAGDDVLCFGMVEGRPPVRAAAVVVDPQQPVGLRDDPFTGVHADRRVLVLNASEAAQLSDVRDPSDAAAQLLDTFACDAVVVKDGARGAHVATPTGSERVAPCWSDHVAPLGTGDCFSAALAAAWFSGAEPVDAARAASACTAQYTAAADVTPPAFDGDRCEPVPMNDARVYLAAPFFTLAERWQVELCRNHLLPSVFSPLHDVGHGGTEVATEDIRGLEGCHAVLALVEGNDPGTLFEVGWATSRGIPVVGYAARPDAEGAKMMTGLGCELVDDLATALYRAVWHAMAYADGA